MTAPRHPAVQAGRDHWLPATEIGQLRARVELLEAERDLREAEVAAIAETHTLALAAVNQILRRLRRLEEEAKS